MENQQKNASLMHPFKGQKSSGSPAALFFLFIIVILLGAGAGWYLSKHADKIGGGFISLPQVSSVASGKIYGSGDTSTFKDTAQGVVQSGGIGGEGQYHLVRAGGSSQYVYMTSSTLDLSQFVGKKVKVWGQTQTAQQAGWLMDVGRVQVLE